jgi:hypothetical protein
MGLTTGLNAVGRWAVSRRGASGDEVSVLGDANSGSGVSALPIY